MIGTGAMIMESLSVLIPGALIVICLWYLFIKKQKITMVFLVPIGVILTLTGMRFYSMNKNHSYLKNLTVKEVAAIKIGDRVISDPAELEPIIKALTEHEWFAPNHGGWAKTLPFLIKDSKEKVHAFKIGYYLRKEGAVIEFYRPHGSARFTDGYGFSPSLPSLFLRFEINLANSR